MSKNKNWKTEAIQIQFDKVSANKYLNFKQLQKIPRIHCSYEIIFIQGSTWKNVKGFITGFLEEKPISRIEKEL